MITNMGAKQNSGAMTARQYCEAVMLLGWTVYSAREHLGISRAQSHRYGSGAKPVPETVAKLLQAMLRLQQAGLPYDDV
jgi:hypothetical protein